MIVEFNLVWFGFGGFGFFATYKIRYITPEWY